MDNWILYRALRVTAVLQVSTVLDHVKNSNKICGSQKRYTKMQAIEKSTYSICERTTCMHEKGAQLQKLSVARRQSTLAHNAT